VRSESLPLAPRADLQVRSLVYRSRLSSSCAVVQRALFRDDKATFSITVYPRENSPVRSRLTAKLTCRTRIKWL
jgi:hypothetical protein